MISGKSKDKLIIVSEYVIVFLVISLAFFFMIPQSDVFLFARATHGELSEVINHALYYGNGRLLGNIIGMFFSNYFEYAFLTVSVGLTLMIALLNEFLFNQSKYMIIPLALIVMFPSSGMISEAYYVFPAFCNYVLPCVFFLISVICIKRITDIEKLTFPASCFFALTIVVSGVSVCLFSENTTIIALTFSVLQLLYTFATMKKVKFLQVVYTFSVFIGAAIMYLLPKITKTSHNMDHYRSVEISIHRILASFARFSEVMISLSLVLAILSVALILLCWKKTNFSPIIKYMLTSFYVLFTVVSFIFRDFETADIYISRINFIAIAVVGAYIMLTIIIIFSLDEKQIRFQMLLYGVLLASSIAPMMFVNQYGFRTYYLTAIIILMIACSALKKMTGSLNINFECKKDILKKSFCLNSIVAFVMLGLFLFVQTVYNYDFYVIRTDLIKEQIEDDAGLSEDEFVLAITLPFEGISVEDEFSFNNVMYDILPQRPKNIRVVSISDSVVYEEISRVLESNFIDNLRMAIKNLEYKNPMYILK